MTLEAKIFFAICLDIFIGDPRYGYHPVILIGKLARFIERKCNKKGFRFFKGVLSSLVIYTIIFLVIQVFLIFSSYFLTALVGEIFEIILIYMLLAIKDLSIHVLRVYKALRADDLKRAREEVSMIVGRDTKKMNEQEIIRASIETVAENLVDGITAPLFYAFLFGLPGIALYKGINTLDSLWGHKNDRFFYFGKFAARIDDFANYIPSRLTAPLISLACFFFGCSPLSSLKVLIRDRNKHPSPNAGYPESAMAGALRIKLGGKNSYNGIISYRPELGDGIEVIKCQHIKKSLGIVLLSTFFFYFLFLIAFT